MVSLTLLGALSPRHSPQYPSNKRSGGNQIRSVRCGREESFAACGNLTTSPPSSRCRYPDWAELFWFPVCNYVPLTDFYPHKLRRTFASWGEDPTAFPLYVLQCWSSSTLHKYISTLKISRDWGLNFDTDILKTSWEVAVSEFPNTDP